MKKAYKYESGLLTRDGINHCYLECWVDDDEGGDADKVEEFKSLRAAEKWADQNCESWLYEVAY